MIAIVLLVVLEMMSSLSPRADHWRLALATAEYLASNPPLFVADYTRRRSAAILVAIQYRESGFDETAIGDSGRSFCAMQNHVSSGGRFSMLIDPNECVVHGAELVRTSFKICRDLPATERLAIYTRGKCESEEGRRISRDRFRLAAQLEKGAKRPVVTILEEVL